MYSGLCYAQSLIRSLLVLSPNFLTPQIAQFHLNSGLSSASDFSGTELSMSLLGMVLKSHEATSHHV